MLITSCILPNHHSTARNRLWAIYYPTKMIQGLELFDSLSHPLGDLLIALYQSGGLTSWNFYILGPKQANVFAYSPSTTNTISVPSFSLFLSLSLCLWLCPSRTVHLCLFFTVSVPLPLSLSAPLARCAHSPAIECMLIFMLQLSFWALATPLS